jgi:hypothetical protein
MMGEDQTTALMDARLTEGIGKGAGLELSVLS